MSIDDLNATKTKAIQELAQLTDAQAQYPERLNTFKTALSDYLSK